MSVSQPELLAPDRSVTHHTVRVERLVNAPPSKVFDAWRQTELLRRWYAGRGVLANVLEHDFRVGGVLRLKFGPSGNENFHEDCRYEDIVDGVRICYVMTIARDGRNISTSLVTAQFLPLGANCSLRVTDQLAILDGRDTDCARAGGWGDHLDALRSLFA